MKTKIWLFLWCVFFFGCGLLVWFWSAPIKAQLQESFDTSTGSNTYEKIETWLDLEADASYQKFLDEKHPFQDPQYEPSDLAPIPSDFTFNAARKFQLRQEAWTQFADMAWHFQNHFKGNSVLPVLIGHLNINNSSWSLIARISTNVQNLAAVNIRHDLHLTSERTNESSTKQAWNDCKNMLISEVFIRPNKKVGILMERW